MIVEIVDLQNHYKIKNSIVKRVAKEVLGKKGKGAKLSIAFVDNSEIKKLNKRYFDSNEVTDVIAFPLDDHKSELNGEIVVSVETAVDTAGIDVEGEIILYVVHGLLHLMGYRDEKRDDFKIMHDKESAILKTLGYNVPEVEDGFQ
ncbi:metal-dependent hydrolase [Candidatus Scalindua japonica]|uniref:Endoribonuclease YbeY n=1 Tax=Candidatus Scalindua japonica TaxID=1284222 RepID=A0A286TUM1_9BACT|nr:rRNA maturation RNase YbeY [Candidatus Scalindua japonica]GAX59592.1 metal-dependent hydrolase [Candidatus Scalindua japonica]